VKVQTFSVSPESNGYDVETNDGKGAFRTAGTIALLAGVWFFVSVWVYGSYAMANAWNNWIVGATVAILAALRMGYPEMTMRISWVNCLLGIWIFASPWIYEYNTQEGRFINSLCVGVVLFCVALWNALSAPERPHSNQMQTHP